MFQGEKQRCLLGRARSTTVSTSKGRPGVEVGLGIVYPVLRELGDVFWLQEPVSIQFRDNIL